MRGVVHGVLDELAHAVRRGLRGRREPARVEPVARGEARVRPGGAGVGALQRRKSSSSIRSAMRSSTASYASPTAAIARESSSIARATSASSSFRASAAA